MVKQGKLTEYHAGDTIEFDGRAFEVWAPAPPYSGRRAYWCTTPGSRSYWHMCPGRNSCSEWNATGPRLAKEFDECA